MSSKGVTSRTAVGGHGQVPFLLLTEGCWGTGLFTTFRQKSPPPYPSSGDCFITGSKIPLLEKQN